MSPLEAPSGSDLIITITSDAVDKLKELRAEEGHFVADSHGPCGKH